MRLRIKNIGKIKSAEIEIAGITVIAGENNTGKSTVGKALWSVFNSFHDSTNQITRERLTSIGRLLENLLFSTADYFPSDSDAISELPNKFVHDSDSFRDDADAIRKAVMECFENMGIELDGEANSEQVNQVCERIGLYLRISDDEIAQNILAGKLRSEFNGQVNNIYTTEAGQIDLIIKESPINVLISENEVTDVIHRVNLKTEAVYFDDPFVLDEIADSVYPFLFQRVTAENHRDRLGSLLLNGLPKNGVLDEIVASQKLEKAYELLDEACLGEIVRGSRRFEFRENGAVEQLDIRNISTGMKTFAVMKMLITAGVIEENGTIILDEPEIHLHPSWQLLFAELIVVLQKQFGLHALITTHSPYFMQAIEVYSKKYETSESSRYYYAHMRDGAVSFDDATADPAPIYDALAHPFQVLADEEAEL